MPLLMTWKPEHWPHSNILRLIEDIQRDGFVIEPWRISAFRQARVGDRVWILRQGREKRGIFGVGEVAAPPIEQEFKGESRMMVPVRITRLVDPEKRHLLRLSEISSILDASQINTQASGITVTQTQSDALEALLPLDERAKEGEDWSPEEVRACVADYFDMLQAEIRGEQYSKSAHRAALRRIVARTEVSIERKHQNISAVLHELGFRWIDGYKPLGHAQKAVAIEVSRYLTTVALELDRAVEAPEVELEKAADVFVDAPRHAPLQDIPEELRTLAKKFDIAKRDARNRELGRSGEEFVFKLERMKLHRLGMTAQAKEVCWVARDYGDGLGYDIRSYAEDGNEMFIEVKTTRGRIGSPFFITERERAVAERNASNYYLYRVFQFGKEPRIYVLKGTLEKHLDLRPTNYRARVK